jgi:hypothetical protein
MSMIKQRKTWDSLEDILKGSWSMLKRGAARFNDPFHWPVLGTLGQEGCSQRSVILRRFILSERILVCNTDARAGKVMEIKNNPKVSWLFYHPKEKIQLRIAGRAELHTDDTFADEQWAATPIPSRLNYCAESPPGTPVDKPTAGLPDFLVNKLPTLMNTEKGRKNFLTISSTIESMDWLSLNLLGNRRARFDWRENKFDSSWLIP